MCIILLDSPQNVMRQKAAYNFINAHIKTS